MATWICPQCQRKFARKNQRHACGTGERAEVLRNRPPEIVELFESLEKFAKSLGGVEFVTRQRYVLLRSTRIFTDVVIMKDALRLAIHLPREVKNKLFEKIVSDRRHVTHVAKVRKLKELDLLLPLVRQAYEHSLD